RADERLDYVRRRTELGVAPAEIDERRAIRGGRGRHTAEQRDKVLRREPLKAGGPWTHPVIVFAHDLSRLGSVNLVEALAVEIGPRPAGTDEASRAADLVADAFREL